MGQDSGDSGERDNKSKDRAPRVAEPADGVPGDAASEGRQPGAEEPDDEVVEEPTTEPEEGAAAGGRGAADSDPRDSLSLPRVRPAGPAKEEAGEDAQADSPDAPDRGGAKSGAKGEAVPGAKAGAKADIPPSRPPRDDNSAAGRTRLLSGRYRLGTVLGRGGMGTVWRARDEVLGRTVAVKELRLPPGVDEGERKRLVTRTLREAKAIATIRSHGVVTIYDVVDEGGRPWIVMELIEGRSLADIIRHDGPMSPQRAAETGLAILTVLRAAHRAGILHRDVKPSNVIVAEEDGRVVLTDFGIAKVEGDPSITSTGMLVGAPSYISPERARGELLGPPADMWSLGALLYCAVEGRPPYDEGGAIATLAAVMNDPVRPPAQAGPLSEAITGLLCKVPADRLDEARTRELLQAALDRATDAGREGASDTSEQTMVVRTPGAGEPPAGPEPTPREPLPAISPPRSPSPGSASDGRRRALVIAAIVVVLLAALGTAIAATLIGGADDKDGSGGTTGEGGSGDSDAEPSDAAGEKGGEDGAESGESGEEPDDGQEGGEPAEDTTESGPPGTAPENDPDASFPPESPSGYAEVTDGDFRFAMSLPAGWERTGTAGQNSGAIYSDPAGGLPRVQVDFTSSPGADAEAAWRLQESAVQQNSTGYERLSLETVDWRDYPTVADWEFERTEDGERVRVVNRGFQVDGDHGYAIMITCGAEKWDGKECRTLRDTAFGTFQPLD